MNFVPDKISDYALLNSKKESELLYELNRQTHLKILQPRMLSGHEQGRLLSHFSHMLKPQRILEIGTYTGYSALCLAEGLSSDGLLYTIDINAELEAFAMSYFERSDFASRIKMLVGDALEIIPTLDEKWDLVFIDADKSNYSAYFDMIINRMNKGGYIIADNVLWSGKVVEEVKKNDVDTHSIIAFNSKVTADPRVENALLPIRDGLQIMRVI